MKNNFLITCALIGVQSINFSIIVDDFSNTNKSGPLGPMNIPTNVTINNNFEGSGPELRKLLSSKYNFNKTDATNYSLDYDQTNSGPSTITYNFSNDIDITSNSILKLNFNNISTNFESNFIFNCSNGANRAFNDVKINTTDLIYQIDFGTGGIDTGTFDLTKVNSIILGMNSNATTGLQFSLDSVEAVPEPFSIISLGVGMAGFIKKRKKKNI